VGPEIDSGGLCRCRDSLSGEHAREGRRQATSWVGDGVLGVPGDDAVRADEDGAGGDAVGFGPTVVRIGDLAVMAAPSSSSSIGAWSLANVSERVDEEVGMALDQEGANAMPSEEKGGGETGEAAIDDQDGVVSALRGSDRVTLFVVVIGYRLWDRVFAAMDSFSRAWSDDRSARERIAR
jgi:hypothetical protein